MTARRVKVTIPPMNGEEAQVVTITVWDTPTPCEGYLTPLREPTP